MEFSNFLVSIRCETFNQSRFIKYALDGFVLQQTTFPFVAVVIDDSSIDGEQGVIKEYIDRYFNHSKESGFKQWETEDAFWTFARHKENVNCCFVVLYLKENLYLHPRKDELVKEWEGKYIAYCEGDDYWTDPFKLEKQVGFMETHENYSMCCTGFSQTFDDNEGIKQSVVFDLDEIIIDNILREQWIGTLTVLYRRELISDYTPPIPNLLFGDLPMWCHLAMKGKLKYLKDITANYRRLSSSACHFSDKEKQFRFSLDAMRVREYYAKLANKVNVAQPIFSKNSHYYFEQCYKNQWFDFPMDVLWHFVKEYGNPSGYDRLKHWGMKSKGRYWLSKYILSVLKSGEQY